MPSRDELLRRVWKETIDSWQEHHWIEAAIADRCNSSDVAFTDAILALRSLVKKGATASEIGAIARMVAYEVIFGFLTVIAEQGLEGLEDDATNLLDGLREDLLSADPSGREGRSDTSKQ